MTSSATGSGNRKPSSSIVSSREPKHGHPVMPTEPNEDKVPVARQWLLGMRRFTRKALDRADYVVREVETRLYPTLRHAEGCPAVENDELHCLDDVYETNHTAECLASKTTREGEDLEAASPICQCPKTLVRKGCPDRELRLTLRCILETLIDLTEQAPIRKFSADEMYFFPTRDGYTAMVAEIEYLRERLAELAPDEAPRLGAPEIVREPPANEPPTHTAADETSANEANAT
jgi:hypothetical protein